MDQQVRHFPFDCQWLAVTVSLKDLHWGKDWYVGMENESDDGRVLCLDSLEGVGWLTIDNQQGEGEGISKRLFRFQDCSKLMELWHLRKLQCKTVEPGWCGGLKLFRKSTGTWYIYACTYIIYINKYTYLYIYKYTYRHTLYTYTYIALYISCPSDVVGFGIGSPTFQEEGCAQNRSFVFQYCEAGRYATCFFLSREVVSYLSWWNTAGGWRPFVSWQKKSGASLTYLSWTWAELFWG